MDYYNAVIQYYGNCIASGMPKGEANRATREKFTIASPDTVYKIIRRVIKRRSDIGSSEYQNIGGMSNG